MSPRKSKLPLILGAIVAVLLCYNAKLLMDRFQREKDEAAYKEKTTRELAESAALSQELEINYNSAIAEMEKVASESSRIKSTIEKQKKELSKSKSKIQQLILDNKGTQEELIEVRRMMASFYSQRDGFFAEIAELKRENRKLVAKTVTLKEEKQVLKGVVDEQRVIEEDLRMAKSNLEVDKADLEVVNRSLKVEKDELRSMASVLKTNDIKSMAIKVRNNGEEKEVKFGRRTDRIKVCFDLLENNITKPGPQKIYLRIINPTGETIAIEDQGSGILKDQHGGQTRYTTSEVIEYENAPTEMCMYWTDDNGFNKGVYTTELYHQGYMIGKEEILLK